MELFLILSRENETLPLAELEAVLNAEKIDYHLEIVEQGIIKLKTLEDISLLLGKRMGYAHEISQFITESNPHKIPEIFSKIKWKDILGPDFAIRVKQIGCTKDIDCQEMEKELGNIVKKRVGDKSKVKLEKPSTFIRVLITNSLALIGVRKVKIDKKHFFDLKPHKRPFFYPGSMSPKLARCMVNLSQIIPGDLLLDPFCGTGGILIEAGIIGACVVGTDIDEKMVQGTKKNLKYYQIKDFKVLKSDARYLKLDEKVKAVVTDPPYGISASTAGEDSGKIYKEFLESVSDNLTEDGRICIATPHYVDLNDLLNDTPFKLVDRHEIRMHKSLTRVISVLVKE